ncbi:MAG: AMP-binding protein [Acidimicrobiia bacterium]
MARALSPFLTKGLPRRDEWPHFQFSLPSLQYPSKLNAATELLDRAVERGWGPRPCLITDDEEWTYSALLQRANRLAHVLVDDHGLQPGDRIVLRSWNSPWTVAWWFAALKVGGVVVTTSPLLKEKEIRDVLEMTQPAIAVCHDTVSTELEAASPPSILCWGHGGSSDPLRRAEHQPDSFSDDDSDADDVCLVGSTSGTTGKPKAPCHFHRSVLAIADTFSAEILRPRSDDVFAGTPSLAFTYGLGALMVFPMRVGAASVLFERGGPDVLADAIDRHSVSVCFTAPKAYLDLADLARDHSFSSLRIAVSGGEHLPAATSAAFREATGVAITNGIGSTELLHNFISSPGAELPPGATGRAIPGFEARVVGDEMVDAAPGEPGQLAVRGPTGCLYLHDERQREYVRRGWNYTGDVFIRDEDDVFWYQGRADDMVVASGYNVSPVEVEEILLGHPLVADCGVASAETASGTSIVKAWVVLAESLDSEPTDMLRQFVKSRLAVYKCPREIEYVTSLPRTANGKLRRRALGRSAAEA